MWPICACDSCRLSCLGADNLFGSARCDVTVRFVPTHGALKSYRNRTGLKTKLASRARTIHEHHVLRDLYAFDWNLRLAANQARKSCLCIGYTQRETVRNL